MREARAEEHRNGLKAAAGGVPLALGSALPTSATGNTVKIEQESAIPEEPPTKRSVAIVGGGSARLPNPCRGCVV